MEDEQVESNNSAENQNDTNVIQVEIHRENTVEQSHTPEDIQVTLEEEDQTPNPPEQEEPSEKSNHPETPEDILKSPQEEKGPEDNLGKKV